MPKTKDEIINAANQLDNQLLGTEVTPDIIRSCLDELCEGWSEDDKEWVLLLAYEFADTVGDADECVRIAMDRGDDDVAYAWEIHYQFVAQRLGVYLGRRDDDQTEEERQQSYHERHVDYPLHW